MNPTTVKTPLAGWPGLVLLLEVVTKGRATVMPSLSSAAESSKHNPCFPDTEYKYELLHPALFNHIVSLPAAGLG